MIPQGKLYEEIFETLKGLQELKINHTKRKGLVKECYNYLNYLFDFAGNLKESIQKAKEKNLEGKTAYSFIVDNLKNYDDKLAVGLVKDSAPYQFMDNNF